VSDPNPLEQIRSDLDSLACDPAVLLREASPADDLRAITGRVPGLHALCRLRDQRRDPRLA
jgi:hypothetical protein